MTQEQQRLVALLSNLDVPPLRRTPEAVKDAQHLRWLSRNLFVRNSGHPDFSEAEALVRNLLGEATR